MKRRTFLMGAFAGTAALILGSIFILLSLVCPMDSEGKDYRLLFSVLFTCDARRCFAGCGNSISSRRKIALLDAIKQSISVYPMNSKTELFELLDMLENRLWLTCTDLKHDTVIDALSAELTEMLKPGATVILRYWQTAYLGCGN